MKFDELFEQDDFEDFYDHLCKTIHVSNIKLSLNYLYQKKEYTKYIVNIYKCELIILECMLMKFLNKISIYKNNLYEETIIEVGSIVMLNSCLYISKFNNKDTDFLNSLSFGKKNKEYIERSSNRAKQAIQIINEKKKELKEYIDNVNEILIKKYQKLNYSKEIDELGNQLLKREND